MFINTLSGEHERGMGKYRRWLPPILGAVRRIFESVETVLHDQLSKYGIEKVVPIYQCVE
jgi:hypothetical protein